MIKLLIIDDEQHIALLYQRYLQKSAKAPFTYFTAANAREGMKLGREVLPNVILLDYGLPDKTGLEVLQEIKNHDQLKDSQVIMLTGLGNEKVAVEAMKMGAVDYIVKNRISKDELIKVVDQAVEKYALMQLVQKQQVKIAAKETQCRDLQRRMEKEKSEFSQSVKLKDDYLAICSHDLKAPISIIKTSMELILAGIVGELGSTALEIVKRSSNQASYAIRLIEDLLDLGKIEQGVPLQREDFSINALIALSIETFLPSANEKKAVIVFEEGGDYIVHADRDRIFQVINNVLGNAVKFSSSPGTISISLNKVYSRRIKDRNRIFVHLAIENQGPLIPVDKRQSIFDRYAQVKGVDNKKGTGLGLAIAKEFVSMHQGDIYVEEAKSGDGSRFNILLPLAPVDTRVLEKAPRDMHICHWVNKESDDTNIENQLRLFGYTQVLRHEVDIGAPKGIDPVQVMTVDLFIVDHSLLGQEDTLPVELLSQLVQRPILMYGLGLQPPPDNIYISEILNPNYEAVELDFKIKRMLCPVDIEDFYGQYQSGRPTILIIDDEVDICQLLARYIGDENYNLLMANDGLGGLNLFRRYHVNLMIVDVFMPVIDGFELAHYVQLESPETPIIFFSGKNSEEMTKIACDGEWVSEVMQKPWSKEQTLAVIKKYLPSSD